MKLLKSWEDRRFSIHNDLYVLPNGIKVLHAINPTSLDTVVSTVIRAGSSFEPLIGVPNGTSHFMEHMLVNPNDVFKTQKEIDAFEYGDTGRPRLEVNAGTSKKYMYIYGYSNVTGEDRLLDRLETMLHYPTDLFDEHIEGERKVILAEMARMQKSEKDQDHAYNKFLVSKELPNFSHRIIGEMEEVAGITVEDLRKFHNSTFITDNVVISVQSPEDLSRKVLSKIENMGKRFNGDDAVVSPVREKLRNTYTFRHFSDEHEHGVFVSFNYFFPVQKRVQYRKVVLFSLLADLLYKLGYDILREELGLVYAFETFRFSRLAFKHDVRGFKCNAEVHNFPKLLDAIHDLVFSGLVEFLKSEDGKKWFDNSVSRYIFPHTNEYDVEYAETRSLDVLEDCDIYLFDKAVKVAKKLRRDDLIEYIESTVLTLPPHVWVVSPQKDDEMVNALKKSKVHAKWGLSDVGA